jgi:hypothetical protein
MENPNQQEEQEVWHCANCQTQMENEPLLALALRQNYEEEPNYIGLCSYDCLGAYITDKVLKEVPAK